MDVKTTVVFNHLVKSNKRITIEQGGSRSSKTYNILIWIIFYYCQKNNNKTITITRKSFPSLRNSVMRDFFEILNNYGIYDSKKHNRTEHTYELNGNLIEFFSMDDASKKRGAKRDILFMNEANEFSFEDFNQLMMRTSERAILDFNPSDLFHWIYDKVETREDAEKYITTFQDNPFLDDEIKKEIENLKNVDYNLYKIYAKGEIGTPQTLIYNNWKIVDQEIEGEEFYGIDFGYNHPTAIVRTIIGDGEIYVEELLYESYLTSEDLVTRMKNLDISEDVIIIADSSRPEMINEINAAGYRCIPTKKGKNSVVKGINFIKKHKLLINKNSSNLLKELKTYKWKEDKDGVPSDEPVKFKDDGMDAIRYAVEQRSGGDSGLVITSASW